MKKRNASAVVYLIFMFTTLLGFCAFAIDATIIFTTRAKLQSATEMTAFAAASAFNSSTMVIPSDIESAANNTFNLLKVSDLKHAKIVTPIDVKLNSKKVLIKTQVNAQTYFLAFLGVPYVELNAQALAVSEELPVTANYTNINWVTRSQAYITDIISKWLNFNDTAILSPIGGFMSASIEQFSSKPLFYLIAGDDDTPLSLGPGGYITVKLPNPIIDKPGPDLFVKESGASLEGYFVFVGLDKSPTNPYVDYSQPGDGIKWKNISCSGISDSKQAGNNVGAYEVSTTTLGPQVKFYGSGSFDIGGSCSGAPFNLSMAKYLRIVDDNDESAFVKSTLPQVPPPPAPQPAPPYNYYKAMMYGESSTPTAGVDIDTINVLNHVKLRPPSTY